MKSIRSNRGEKNWEKEKYNIKKIIGELFFKIVMLMLLESVLLFYVYDQINGSSELRILALFFCVLFLPILLASFATFSILKTIKSMNLRIEKILCEQIKRNQTINILNKSDDLEAVLNTINQKRDSQIDCLFKMSKGNFECDGYQFTDEDPFDKNLRKMRDSIYELRNGLKKIASGVHEHLYNVDENFGNYSGIYQEMMICSHQTLLLNLRQLKEAQTVFDMLAAGLKPQRILTDDKSDHLQMNKSINLCIDSFEAIEETNQILSRMSVNDYSKTFEGNYTGIYAEIGKSINDIHEISVWVINAFKHLAIGEFIDDLKELNSLGGRISENDEYIPSIMKAMNNILLLLEETRIMTENAVDGNLLNRGDVSKFEGEYARIITGFNQTLDAITAPIEEASEVLHKLSCGNLNILMTGNYNGENGKIKNDLNKTIDFLKGYICEIISVLKQIGAGNLTSEVRSEFVGDFRQIKESINGITKILNKVIYEIRDAAEQVDAGASHMSTGGQVLAQGATEQASSVETLTLNIEEIALKIKENAKNVGEVSALTNEIFNDARCGNELLNRLVESMNDINDASNNISKIIKVIDDIAFQTNILALNAAVEAARAGTQGKGFAVVAEEVRALAVKSSVAAKQTNDLIDKSVGKVKVGSKLADNTAKSFDDIILRIETVSELLDSIAISSNDQTSEINYIKLGVDQVSVVVQSNAATAEESAASCEELSGQAHTLKLAVSQFKV